MFCVNLSVQLICRRFLSHSKLAIHQPHSTQQHHIAEYKVFYFYKNPKPKIQKCILTLKQLYFEHWLCTKSWRWWCIAQVNKHPHNFNPLVSPCLIPCKTWLTICSEVKFDEGYFNVMYAGLVRTLLLLHIMYQYNHHKNHVSCSATLPCHSNVPCTNPISKVETEFLDRQNL